MSNITAENIKLLREKTGAGMMDCKKALEEAELKIRALNTMIDMAEEQLKIEIRKKSGAKQF